MLCHIVYNGEIFTGPTLIKVVLSIDTVGLPFTAITTIIIIIIITTTTMISNKSPFLPTFLLHSKQKLQLLCC